MLADPTRCTATCGAALPCGHPCGGKCGGCVRRLLSGSYGELVEGWLAAEAPQVLRDAWERHNGARVPPPPPPPRGAPPAVRPPTANVPGWLGFLSEGGLGAAYRASYLAFLRARLAAAAQPPPDGDAAAAAADAATAAARVAASHMPCARPCGRQLVCGHACTAPCHGAAPCGACAQPCWLGCAHHPRCPRPCGQPCVPCAEACVWACAHRGRCGAPCGAPCDRLPCDERCTRLLGCGHRCPGLCGEECPPAAFCLEPACLAAAPDRIRNQLVDLVMQRTLAEVAPAEADGDPLLVLPCGHALLVSSLDGLLELERCYTRDPTSLSWLHPLPLGARDEGGKQPVKTCPTCRAPIHGVRRYGRPVNKASLDLVERKHLHACAVQLAAAEARLGAAAARVQPQERLAAALAEAEAAAAVAERRARNWEEGAAAAALLLAPAMVVQFEAVAAVGLLNAVCDANLSPPKRRVYEAAVVQLRRAEAELAEGEAAAAGSALARRLATARQDLQSLRPDSTQLCRARAGILRAAEIHMAAAAAGLQHAGRLISTAAAGVAADAAARDAQLRGRGQPRAAGGGRQGVRLGTLRSQAQQLLLSAIVPFEALLQRLAPAWAGEAAAAANYNRAFELGAAAMRTGLAQVALLQTAVGLPRAAMAGLPPPEWLRALQTAALAQVRAAGGGALALYQGGSGLADKGYDNAHITAVREMLTRLDEAERVQEAAEMLAALRAVASAEPYSGADPVAWLSGHLYTCPNGHPYTIGNCGGAAERATCPECGVAIGGGSYVLAAGNRPADEVLARLREAGRGGA